MNYSRLGIVLLAFSLTFTGILVAQQSSDTGQALPSQSTSSGPQAGQLGDTGPAVTLVDAAKIYAENPMGWVGKRVTLQNVTVQDTNDSGNFWVGADSGHRLLVVRQKSNPTLQAMRFHKRDVVTISGRVEAASRYMAQATSAEQGSMHDAQKTSGVFLMADSITVDSSTHK